MAELTAPTSTDRAATRQLADAILQSVRDNVPMPLPFEWPKNVPLDCPDCPVSDVEELIVQLAQEIALLVQDRGDKTAWTEEKKSNWQEIVDAYPREEFLAAFREAHATLHRLWSAQVGKEGYDKEAWKTLDNALSRFARDAAEKVGIGRSGALL